MSRDSSPSLIIRFPPGVATAARDRVVALLADHHLIAIQEDGLPAPRVWTAHFESAASRDAAAAALGALDDIGSVQIEPVEVADEDWATRTQADLPAIRVGRLVIAPPWDLPATAGHLASIPAPRSPLPEIVVQIEPSRGFGTGHHQSTRLCLVLLQQRDLAGRTVIDVGTGSGVLAIAAARLGAAYVSAIDVDADAIENARENVERNAVPSIVEAHVCDLDDARLAPADLVTANLTGALLARHAAPLGALVRPSGSLLVAGFTVDEKDLVASAFAPAFEVVEAAEEDDWWAFVFGRLAGAK